MLNMTNLDESDTRYLNKLTKDLNTRETWSANPCFYANEVAFLVRVINNLEKKLKKYE